MSYEINSGGLYNIRAVVPDGCGVCAALADEWGRNHDRDVLIEINNHPHEEPKLARVEDWISKRGMRVHPEGATA